MPRKKTPTNTNAAAAAVNLDDDEELVEQVTTTKRIGRERRKPAAEETIDGELIDDDGDFDDADGDDEPRFADNSIASLLFNDDGEERLENQFCTIAIRRKPDSMNDKFLTPCAAVTNLPPLRNIEVTADKFDIEDRVRVEYGGGHYYFQIFFDGRLRTSWQSTLADDPAAVARARAEADAKTKPELTTAQPTTPVDPLDSMIASITKMQMLKEAMFGDEQKRLERQIEELKAQVAAKPEPQNEPKSDQLYILEKALATQSPTLQEKLLDYAFPADGGGHWIPETVKTVFEHKEEIGGILAGLIGGLAGQRPAAPPNIAALLKQQPPAGALPPQPVEQPPPLPTSSFRRKPVDSPTPAETGEDADARSETEPAAILGEVEIEQPSAEFLASMTIQPQEVIDPFTEADENESDSGDATEKTDNGE